MTNNEKKNNVLELHNDIAEDYSHEFWNDTSDHGYVVSFLTDLNGEKILDAGCGDGKDTKFMIEQGFNVVGVDFSSSFIEIARRKVPYGNFQIVDITDLSQFEDNTFDGVFAGYSLQHIPAELLDQTLNGFSRILKPNGKLLLFLQSSDLGEQMIVEPLRPNKKLYINFLSSDKLNNILLKNGFDPTKIDLEKETLENALSDGKLIVQSSNRKLELTIKDELLNSSLGKTR